MHWQMRTLRSLRIGGVLLIALAAGQGGILLDQTAVTIGNDVITESEVLEEIRVTAFLNGAQPDFSGATRRQAAERLVDQSLLGREMKASDFQAGSNGGVDKLLEQIKTGRFRNEAEYQEALRNYGISEAQLLKHLNWQIASLQFVQFRFAGAPPPAAASALEPRRPSAAGAPAAANSQAANPQLATPQDSNQEPAAAQGTVDENLERWLKQARSNVNIEFHKEAFE
jgi:hypothetical protein